MIKFLMQGNEGPIIGFGLSEGNIERLRKGQPILVNLAELDVGLSVRIMIVLGETEADVLRDLSPFITQDTRVIGEEDGDH